ncbi:MAG: hypothetical protein ACJA04_000120 [Cellvibrionaceae bacterium]|jgi:hypothetical protein
MDASYLLHAEADVSRLSDTQLLRPTPLMMSVGACARDYCCNTIPTRSDPVWFIFAVNIISIWLPRDLRRPKPLSTCNGVFILFTWSATNRRWLCVTVA